MVFKILEDDSYIRCILVGSLVDHENWPLWTRCGGGMGRGILHRQTLHLASGNYK